MPRLLAALALLTLATSAHAQMYLRETPDSLNKGITGTLVDFTHNHGQDNRLYSPILGMRRDLYVYLPPGYCRQRAYPLIFWLHGGFGDEHGFLMPARLKHLDKLIATGQFPSAIVVCPDATYSGRNTLSSTHSFFVNGLGGQMEDHLIREVVPFIVNNFSVRPERETHVLMGISAGGFAAFHLGIKHRDFFGTAIALGAPLNLRYYNTQGNYHKDFDPTTFRWRQDYRPNEVIGNFFGIIKIRARTFIKPVFGTDGEAFAKVLRENPADLLFTTNLQPGELQMFVGIPGRDNFNFDAQAHSFVWLAGQRGIAVTVDEIPGAHHVSSYFEEAQNRAWHWLGTRLHAQLAICDSQALPPVPPPNRPFPVSASLPQRKLPLLHSLHSHRHQSSWPILN